LSLNPGGTERLILELVARLHHEIPMAVCCLDQAGAWAPELGARGVAVTTAGRRPGFRTGPAWAVAAAARRHAATVIHAHHYSPFVYSCIAQIRGRIPVVFTEHGRLSDAGPSAKRKLANRLLRNVPARVFAVSSELGEHLVDEGFLRQQVGVIYNGIDPGPAASPDSRARLRAQLAVSEDTFVIGTVARLDKVKDLGTLLHAIALVAREQAVRLIVIGEGAERRALEDEVETLGLSRSVHFLGARADAREWLWACDAYANSSISEGISLTILEAMAAGLPIAATRVGGTPEVVDETCGRLVPARNPAALGAALLEFARSPSLRGSLGRNARKRLEARFAIDRMVSEYRDVYLGTG
jgi:glycosyltransferase involved in cell wall biosynthesis